MFDNSKCGYCALTADEDPAKRVANIICHWFSDCPLGVPDPNILAEALNAFKKGSCIEI